MFRGMVEPVKFQSTHPVRGATRDLAAHITQSLKFQSTHPVRGATLHVRRVIIARVFQSTHPVRGATRRAEP